MKCLFDHSLPLLVLILFYAGSGCKVVHGPGLGGGSSIAPVSTAFYAHCTSTDLTHEIDIAGTTGYTATAGFSALDGDAKVNQNTSMCSTPWTAFKVRPNFVNQRQEINVFAEGSSEVLIDIDFTPLLNLSNASSLQMDAIVKSGPLFGTVMNCKVYHPAIGTSTYCSVGQTTLASCPNLSWEVCGKL